MTQSNEYIFLINIKRIIIGNNLIKYIKIYKIDILIYQLDYINEIKNLNKIKNIKTLLYFIFILILLTGYITTILLSKPYIMNLLSQNMLFN